MGKGKFTDEQRAQAQAVLDYIEKYPERHNQSSWWDIREDIDVSQYGKLYDEIDSDIAKFDENICETTMCVAGTVIYNNYGTFGLSLFRGETSSLVLKEATRLLGLTQDQGHRLFYDTNNDEAKEILQRIVDNKKNPFKSYEEAWGVTV